MKRIKLLALPILFLISINISYAGCPPQNRPRGMYVDCVREMFDEIVINHTTHNRDAILSYIDNNCISYIAMYDLDDGVVIGDPDYEAELSNFINLAKGLNSDLKVGAVSSSKIFFDKFKIGWFYTDRVSLICNPDQARAISGACNPPQEQIETYIGVAKANAMRMVYNVAVTYNSSYTGQIDVLSLEHEYWSRPFVSQLIYGNPNQSPTTADYDAAFANHLEIMDYMEWVRCFNQRLILESEENLKGSNITKSKLDQAIDIDSRYFNRLLLVDYYNDPDKLLDAQCERLQIFGDSHTDHYTVIWPLFSAEGDNLPEIFCDGTHSSTNVLGNTFLGNILYAQTKTLSDCETTHETDYTAAMVSGNTGSNCPSGWTGGDNIIGGYMWFSSKQLMGYHALPRLSKPDAGNHAVDGHAEVIYPNPSAGQLYMEFLSDNPKTVTLYNANGQIIITDSFVSKTYNLDISGYAKGIYYLMLKDSNGSILKNEIVLN